METLLDIRTTRECTENKDKDTEKTYWREKKVLSETNHTRTDSE